MELAHPLGGLHVYRVLLLVLNVLVAGQVAEEFHIRGKLLQRELGTLGVIQKVADQDALGQVLGLEGLGVFLEPQTPFTADPYFVRSASWVSRMRLSASA